MLLRKVHQGEISPIGDQLLRQLLEDQIAATEVSASAAKEE